MTITIPDGATIIVKDEAGNIVTAEDDGSYVLLDGTYTYTVSKSGYYPTSDSFTVSGAAQTVNVSLSAIVYVPTYAPTVESTDGGSTAVSNQYPVIGQTVTITTAPDAGYEVGKVAVTDQNGNPVAVTDNGDGTYTYVQPYGKVTIEVTYVPVADEPCDGGEGCLSARFSDLNSSLWYHSATDYVLSKGLMNGVGGGKFEPNGTLTRGMLAQILYNLEGRPEVSGDMPFTDVAESRYYYDAIKWASANGIVEGYGSGKFAPDDAITREQLAVMLWRYAGSPAATQKELSFTDAGESSSWAMEALLWANENGVMNGSGNGILNPKGNATRAHVAQMMMNFLKNVK